MLLVHMHDGMYQVIIVELVHSVLLFTFDDGLWLSSVELRK